MSLTIMGAMCCSVSMLNQVSSMDPKAALHYYLKNRGMKENKAYDPKTKAYVTLGKTTTDIHVIFGGPHMATLRAGAGHHSSKGSCDAFAQYLRDNNLGTVVESPPRHNPLHPERALGEGDVIVYIWTPDPEAVIKWQKKNPQPALDKVSGGY